MKYILSVLPLVGLAIAKSCIQETVTTTLTNKVTVTIPAQTVALEEVTSTVDVTTTVFITPSAVPHYPFPNGTFSSKLQFTNSFPVDSSLLASLSSASLKSELDAIATALPVEPTGTPFSEIQFSLFSPVKSGQQATATPAETTTAKASKPTATSTPEIPTSETPATPQPTTPAKGAERANSGEASFYYGNVAGGMCSFNGGYTLPAGVFGTALSKDNWDGSANCGACVSVTGPSGNSIKAMITDRCPTCKFNKLDLFRDAFAKLANPDRGIIPITWEIVPCGITSPIILKNKEGTTKYWYSVQVMNSNIRISKVEVSTDGGSSWKATSRLNYNYFELKSGSGTDSVDIKVTSVSGQSIVVKDVSVASEKQTKGGSNFS